MLFGSLEFVFFFLPITLFLYHSLRISGHAFGAKLVMVVASLFFYGWWDYHYVPLMAGSIIANYALSRAIERFPARAKLGMALGIILNLTLLGYYKYANFFVNTVNAVASTHISLPRILLPLAISFFTFQQIAYLIESTRDRKAANNILDYALFVLFFPHLIAGPITHHKEMLPQFAVAGRGRLARSYILVGTAIFIGGLAKKVVLADGFALFADPLFNAARDGAALSSGDAWLAALGYPLQIYFDFSGYSDMAIGLGLMFGILLPVNFASPYKSVSIAEYWRRWHISLSRFLRNYIYIPLGGNRKGEVRRHLNLVVTMLAGGIWHGAGFTFLVWGLLHGLYLVINNLWTSKVGVRDDPLSRGAGWCLTTLAVVFAFVLFRAESFGAASSILRSMIRPTAGTADPVIGRPLAWAAVAVGFLIVTRLPNLLEMAGYPKTTPGLPIEHDFIREIRWPLPASMTAVGVGTIAAVAIARLPDPGIFIYFNF